MRKLIYSLLLLPLLAAPLLFMSGDKPVQADHSAASCGGGFPCFQIVVTLDGYDGEDAEVTYERLEPGDFDGVQASGTLEYRDDAYRSSDEEVIIVQQSQPDSNFNTFKFVVKIDGQEVANQNINLYFLTEGNGAPNQHLPITITVDDPESCSLGSIVGTFKYGDDKPLKRIGWELTLTGEEERDRDHSDIFLDEDSGRLEISNLPPGTYTLDISYVNPDDNEFAGWFIEDIEVEACEETDLGEPDALSEEEYEDATTVTVEGQEAEESCSGLTIIGWVLCPIIEILYTSIQSFFDLLRENFLATEPLSSQGDPNQVSPETVLYNAWNNFRVIANIAFVIIFLLAIFGNAFDFLFSAYEFKKIVPRLGIGFIGVQLSWYIVAFLIDFFNVLGAGVRALMLAPVEGLQTIDLDFGGLADIVSVVIGGGVAALARFGLGLKGLLGVLPFILLPVLLIIIVSVLVLIFRQLLIFLLVILSPIAFVAWILPGTDKYFKAWWDLFIKALVMYPLIVAFIASGELIAKILVAGDESNGLMQLIGIVALFAPYFLIPQTFKFAGSIISNVTSFVQQRGKDYNNRLLGDIRDPFSYRGRRRAQNQKRRAQRTSDWVARNRGQIPTGLRGTQGLLSPGTYRGRGIRGAFGGLAAGAYTRLGGNVDETMATRAAHAMDWAKTAGDVTPQALIAQMGMTHNPFTGAAIEQKYIDEAKPHLNDSARTTAAMSVMLDKAGNSENIEKVRQALVAKQAAGQMTENQAEQAWHTAAHHVQDRHDDLKHRGWKDGQLHGTEEASKFLKKARNIQTDWAISNQRDTYWNTLKEMHGRIQSGNANPEDLADFNSIRGETLRQLENQYIMRNRDALVRNAPASAGITTADELFRNPQARQQALEAMASQSGYANVQDFIIDEAPKGRESIGAYNAMRDFLKSTSQINPPGQP